MQNVRATLVAAAAAVALVVSSLAASAGEANSKLALTVSVEGAIGPATIVVVSVVIGTLIVSIMSALLSITELAQ